MAVIFDYSIAYVESLPGFEYAVVPARSAGVKGLAVKLGDDNGNPIAATNYEYLKAHGATLRAAGYSLGAWICPRYHPAKWATQTATLYKDLGLSFVVFETEWEYRPGDNPQGVNVAALITPWRAARPKAWTGFAIAGMPPAFNHAAVQADPFSVICPENYWKFGEQYDVRPTFEQAQALGWDLDRVKPTLTGVEGHELEEAIIRCQRARDVLPTPDSWTGSGVLLWRGDMLTAEDYRLVGLADTLALR